MSTIENPVVESSDKLKEFTSAALVLVLALLPPVMCTREDSPVGTDGRLHELTVTIRYDDSSACSGCNVRVPGTNIRGSADTSGTFRAFAVPAGTYHLLVGTFDTLLVITDSDLEIMPPVRVVVTKSQSPPPLLAPLVSVSLSVYDSSRMLDRWQTSSAYCVGRASRISVSGLLRRGSEPYSDSILVRINDSTLWSGISIKGTFAAMGVPVDSVDTLVISCRDTAVSVLLVDSTSRFMLFSNVVFITTGLGEVSSGKWCSGRYWENDTSWACLRSAKWETCDWELELINTSTPDTCSWSNEYSSNGNFRYGKGGIYALGDTTGFRPDTIFSHSASDGEYELSIILRSGPPGMPAAPAVVWVLLGGAYYSNYGEAQRAVRVRSSAALDVGSRKRVGRISLPQRTFVPCDGMVVDSGVGTP